MKKMFFLSLIFLTLFMVTPSFADSPITSTDFHTAYWDKEIVQKAAKSGLVDSEIALYLSSPDNPLDIKAAVINALGWNYEGKNNAENFSQLVYKKSVKELNLEALNGDELFCIGYLKSMDDYFNVDESIKLLERARTLNHESLLVSLITTIIQTQKIDININNKHNVWDLVEEVLEKKELKKDLRTEAIRIIIDYMSSYNDKPLMNSFAHTNKIILWIGKPTLLINKNEYEIDFGRNSKPEVKFDRTFLPISPIINAMGGTTTWDGKQNKVTIKLNSTTLELWIGKKTVIINGNKKENDVAPYLSNARTMLPLRFITENLGCTVEWNGKKNEVTINVPNKTYNSTADELWSIGETLVNEGEYEQANNFLNQALAKDAKYVKAYVSKALVLVLLDKNEEAINTANKALILDAQNATAYNIKAMAYRNLGLYEESLTSCIKATELNPEYAEAFNHKGNALYFLEKFDEAIDAYDTAIKLDPTLYQAYNSKGNILFIHEKFEESIFYYDKAITLNPQDGDFYFNKGHSLFALGQYQEAIKYFDQYIEFDAEYAFVYYLKSCSLAYLNQTNGALNSLKKAVELDVALKENAAKDPAFQKISNTSEFLGIIKG